MSGLIKLDKITYGLNVDPKIVLDNIRHSIRRPFQQIRPYPCQPTELCLIGGGPSLSEELPQLRKLVDAGAKPVTMNGSHQWLLDQGLKPSVHVMLDSRPFNARFVNNPVSTCKYLIASQCHPAVFDRLDGYDVWIWHCVNDVPGTEEILKEHYFGQFFMVPGGSTVMLRAILLMRMLGFKRMHIFGMDSCLNGRHHAYAQPENDDEKTITVKFAGREFQTTVALASQADDFVKFVEHLGDKIDLAFYGDGLIKYIVETAALNTTGVSNGRIPVDAI
jgi:hypothetical protein